MTHAHQTLDLLSNVTDVKLDGEEKTVTDVFEDGRERTVTNVNSASVLKITALNVSRMDIGLENGGPPYL